MMRRSIATAPDKPTMHVSLTAGETALREAEEADVEAKRPMKEWTKRMAETDAGMPRYAEDIIDALSETVRTSIASDTLDKYNNKKQVRGTKPQEKPVLEKIDDETITTIEEAKAAFDAGMIS